MKKAFRYSLIILTLGLFSSCAEQFREIRWSENIGNAFLGGGRTSSTAAKRSDKVKGERVSPQQTLIPIDLPASESAVERTPNPSSVGPKIEKVESNPTSVIQGQKSNVSVKVKKDQIHSFEKMKLSKQVKILKKAKLQRRNGYGNNGYIIPLGIAGIISSH